MIFHSPQVNGRGISTYLTPGPWQLTNLRRQVMKLSISRDSTTSKCTHRTVRQVKMTPPPPPLPKVSLICDFVSRGRDQKGLAFTHLQCVNGGSSEATRPMGHTWVNTSLFTIQYFSRRANVNLRDLSQPVVWKALVNRISLYLSTPTQTHTHSYTSRDSKNTQTKGHTHTHTHIHTETHMHEKKRRKKT